MDIALSNIRVGTSGYSFNDWVGKFYPENIAKGKMLDFYAQYFHTVEINSTYYRIPHPVVFTNMLKKVPDNFDFMIKVPGSFTHRRTNLENDAISFVEAIKPVVEAGKLAGVLAQFPYSFKFNKSTSDYIKTCHDYFPSYPLFVEFRHNSWVNRTMYEALKKEGIGYVCVDEPELDGLLKPDAFATTDTAYIRLHGRNKEHWWEGGALRYDYNYSLKELKNWRDKTLKLKVKVKKMYVFFNNCHHGQAAKNALEFMQLLGI
ncbi:MAG: DUF72 domain-containing protein [FCB group bacterium]|nr:DUF72 domain-containing protein [FCB group bacterium]